MKVGDTIRTRDHIVFPCPFCTGRVTYGIMVARPGLSVITHTLPMCGTFEKHDAMEFMQACVETYD